MHCYFVYITQAAIANAKTLEEVERLNNMLKTGQIPGRDAKRPRCKLLFNFCYFQFTVYRHAMPHTVR